jgi:hypothetical protein
MPRDITKLNRDIREKIPSRKTPINSNSKLKTRIIKN